MKVDEVNILNEKAKERKDGVYSFKDYYYVVKDNKFIGFGNKINRECYMRLGAFNTCIGRAEKYKVKQALADWLKHQ